MSQTFTIPAILDGVTPRKDGGVSLRFVTQEATKDDKITLMEFYQSFGHLLFSANEIKEADIPKANAYKDGGKSPSQRLRAVLFITWQQKGGNGDFEAWYNLQMERILDQLKEKLA